MKLFQWFNLNKDIGTQSAEYFVEMAKEAQVRAQQAGEARKKESLERDLLYINGLMRKNKNDDEPSS